MIGLTTCTLLSVLAWNHGTNAFTPQSLILRQRDVAVAPSSTQTFALTERQMQFWEDVEDGLNDVATVYEEQGLNIDRIRAFAQSAQSKTPAPIPSAPGHQPSEEHVDDLTAKQFWDVTSDPDNFPWAKTLEANAHVIIEELQSKLDREAEQEKEKDKGLFASDSAWQNNVMGTGWSAFRLQRLGVWNVENCKEFPKTSELMRSLPIPFAVRGVCFARQAAGSGVQPHTDGRNFILTSHLGLKVPEGAWLKVGEEQRTWEEGKLVTLDTSFEHSTGNPTDSDRHVLIIDFWHPELSEAERAGLEFVYDLRNKFESGNIPFRRPRAMVEEEGGLDLAGMFSGLFGGGDK